MRVRTSIFLIATGRVSPRDTIVVTGKKNRQPANV
jgi:hypothetical protein